MESNKTGTIKTSIKYILFIGLCVFIGSCSSPKIQPYSKVVEMPTEKLHNGRELFNSHCTTCHPGGKSGLGPSINNKPLPEFLIRFQIRNGIGVMPAFGENVLTDDQVENIAEYLVYLRKSNKKD